MRAAVHFPHHWLRLLFSRFDAATDATTDAGPTDSVKKWREVRSAFTNAGAVRLIEAGTPASGVGYSVKIGALGLWSGDSLADAERRFEQATRTRPD